MLLCFETRARQTPLELRRKAIGAADNHCDVFGITSQALDDHSAPVTMSTDHNDLRPCDASHPAPPTARAWPIADTAHQLLARFQSPRYYAPQLTKLYHSCCTSATVYAVGIAQRTQLLFLITYLVTGIKLATQAVKSNETAIVA